jgi:hypothetical protein
MGPKAGGKSDRRGYECDRLREPRGVESATQPARYVLGRALQFVFDIYRNIYRRVYKIMGPLLIWALDRRTRSHKLRSGPIDRTVVRSAIVGLAGKKGQIVAAAPCTTRNQQKHNSNLSKIHEMSLNLSTWIKIVTVLRKYDPQVTEDTLQVFYGH